jgi:hypothetical protein
MAITSAMVETRSVPETRARTPNAWGLMRADQRVPVKKSIGLTARKNSRV